MGSATLPRVLRPARSTS